MCEIGEQEGFYNLIKGGGFYETYNYFFNDYLFTIYLF